MTTKHLSQGSTRPPKVDGKHCLYSMEFCPYVLRARLVLLAKNVPFDTVNINLKNKPDWYFDIHPKGTVPALDVGSEIIVESLDICDYLDEKYPEPPLYPTDEKKLAQDKELIIQFDAVTAAFSKAFYDKDNKPLSEYLDELRPLVTKYEEELAIREGVFFGGDKPCMVDYMLWPWAPRAHVLKLIYNQDIPSEQEYRHLYDWCRAMRELQHVKDTYTEIDRLYKLNRQYVAGPHAVDYDNI